jgi:hypothetical protein
MRRFANVNNVARAFIDATAAAVVVVVGITLLRPSALTLAAVSKGRPHQGDLAGP